VYRNFEISVPASGTDHLLSSLEVLDQVVSISVHRGASVKPQGDRVAVHALNSRAGEWVEAARVPSPATLP
jgi:hypothetical protein